MRPTDRYWELCQTINDSWGFQHTDTNFKSPHQLLCTFCDCLSMGGNLLLDFGPREDGTIPDEEVAVLKEFGRWTKKHKEAIYGTRAGIPAEHFKAIRRSIRPAISSISISPIVPMARWKSRDWSIASIASGW